MVDRPYDLTTYSTRRAEQRLETVLAFGRLTNQLSWILLCIGIGVLFSFRPLGITWDDLNYITYFSIQEKFEIDVRLIEEPGWRFITWVFQSIFDPFTCVKITIFLAVELFLFSSNKIVNHKWTQVTLKSWFLLFGFLIIPSIGAHAYFGTLRQGFAQSIMLFLAALGVPLYLAAFGAGTVHSGLLPVSGVSFAARWFGKYKVAIYAIATFLLVYALGLAEHLLPSPLANLDLGRRTYSYLHTRPLNFYGYVTILATYFPPLLLLSREESTWIKTSILMFPTTLALAAVNPGFIRLFETLDVVFLVGIATTISKYTGRIAAILFISVTVASGLWESRRGDPRDTYLGQWSLILRHHT